MAVVLLPERAQLLLEVIVIAKRVARRNKWRRQIFLPTRGFTLGH